MFVYSLQTSAFQWNTLFLKPSSQIETLFCGFVENWTSFDVYPWGNSTALSRKTKSATKQTIFPFGIQGKHVTETCPKVIKGVEKSMNPVPFLLRICLTNAPRNCCVVSRVASIIVETHIRAEDKLVGTAKYAISIQVSAFPNAWMCQDDAIYTVRSKKTPK